MTNIPIAHLWVGNRTFYLPTPDRREVAGKWVEQNPGNLFRFENAFPDAKLNTQIGGVRASVN